MQLLDLLKQRSTVRQWKDIPVSDEHIEYLTQCIELIPANQHQFNYNITILTNKEIIDDIFYNYSYCVTENGITSVAKPIPEQLDRKYVTFNGQMQAPAILLASIDGEADQDFEEIIHNAYFATGVIMCAIMECGLDSGMCACLDKPKVAKAIGLSDNFRTVLAVGIGYAESVNAQDSNKSNFDNFFVNLNDTNGKYLGKVKKTMKPGHSIDAIEFPQNKIIRFIP